METEFCRPQVFAADALLITETLQAARSAPGALAEQDAPLRLGLGGVVGDRGRAAAGGLALLDRALHRLARADPPDPGLHPGELVEIDAAPRRVAAPRPAGHVGDGVVAGD